MKVVALLCFALAGCGYQATREARDPQGKLIGSSIVDLVMCAGKPDSITRIMPDAAMAEWAYRDDSPAFKLSLAVIGSMQIGTAGSCKMTASFLRDGTVVDVAFPQCAGTLEGGPYASAAPLVDECMRHENAVSLPASYDAFVNLGVVKP